METFQRLSGIVNDTVYTYYVIPLLIFIGVFYTLLIRGGQFTHLKHVIHLITQPSKNSGNEDSISPFKAFTISAASHIGTGNVVGVAAAIASGGPGAVFWMWVTALIGGASSFVENTLGQIFKIRDEEGTFHGGPAYYIDKALKKPKISIFFSIIISIVYGFMFNAMQSNTIAAAFRNSFQANEKIVGIVLVIVAGAIIFGGLKRIADVTSFLVPIMAVLYMGLAIFIVIKNITLIPHVFSLIFRAAFSVKAVAGGTIGAAIRNGVRRGLFSNEAGMGAVPNASAVADVSHPAKQGLIQAMGVYLDTILVCSATAFIIIIGGEGIYGDVALEGLDITQKALATEVGSWSDPFLTACVLMFAFSSIIGNYYYGENNINHLNWGKSGLTIYRVLVLVVLFVGTVSDFSIVWNTGDIFMGIMACINLVSLLFLGKIAVEVYFDYFKQIGQGIDPVFDPTTIKSLEKHLDEVECWK
ncbi:MAG: alanine/glycine:cation symporter family protein [Tissierellia bacterium]|nr:alanine/glycine:cation symporter family protein [Tissierellia bacterium]